MTQNNFNRHTIVRASAGSGKTYQLVNRIVRLLLTGAEPGHILAITFTRKAANEMQSRLLQRLYSLATCDKAACTSALKELGLKADTAMQQNAGQLYEQVLRKEAPVKTLTFHAFCQELLRRFPLEADVAPGFDLVEQTRLLYDEAWQLLMSRAQTDTALATALDILFDQLGLFNARQALNSFLDHRSDWWAYCRGQDDPLEYAQQRLQQQLDIDPEHDPVDTLLNDASFMHELNEFHVLLCKHDIKNHREQSAHLYITVDHSQDNQTRFSSLKQSLLTQKGDVRVRKESKAMIKSMGEDGVQRFFELNDKLSSRLLETVDAIAAQQTWQRTTAWYQAGIAYLDSFQQLKKEQRLLDFTDLEWQTYLLLNHSNNALWVQYKLDQKIEHLLIDEFQDTNPTQWHLLLPLLEELAASENPEQRSVFIVGDEKQSIYRFRRADPRLFNEAADWMQSHLHAETQPLTHSWRSSPAVMKFVNKLFTSPALKTGIDNFPLHETKKTDLPGKIILLPLSKKETEEAEEDNQHELRNPLIQAREENSSQHFYNEGRLIAGQIRELVENRTAVTDNHNSRAINFNDIIILLRSRSHVADYEQALREHGIPYIGANRGTLLESLEVNDMLDLLQWLILPFDNLSLAGILRSPLFAISNDDLVALSQCGKGSWQEKLTRFVAAHPEHKMLNRAQQLLNQWQLDAMRLPVHDLLDKIYSEADVLNRYKAAFPPHLQQRVTANLVRFLELALEMDSGRYPSLSRFAAWLNELRQMENEAPDEAVAVSNDNEQRVRIMTIHAAKGLEAPVIFLADCGGTPLNRHAHHALVDWPTGEDRPACFLLSAAKTDLDRFSRERIGEQQRLEEREEANLLYVATTRAQQIMFISASESKTFAQSWYKKICKAYEIESEDNPDGLVLEEDGTIDRLSSQQDRVKTRTIQPDTALTRPLEIELTDRVISPSQQVSGSHATHESNEENTVRGIVMHQMLDLLSRQPAASLSEFYTQPGHEISEQQLQQWWQECQNTIQHPDLATFFQPGQYDRVWNEVAIQYLHQGKTVFGIIDRLLIKEDTVTIIDYKTHPYVNAQNIDSIARSYAMQMQLYREGAKLLWPDHQVESRLLFTSITTAYTI